MIGKHATLVLAFAAFAAAPAFAEGGKVDSSAGVAVTSGTGLVVGQGAPGASVTVLPAASVALPGTHLLPEGATVQASSTTTLGGPAGTVGDSRTVVTHYWVNVPSDVEARGEFRRWMALK